VNRAAGPRTSVCATGDLRSIRESCRRARPIACALRCRFLPAASRADPID